MKILISTGGTGGHIYPALLIGKYLKEEGFDVLFTIGKREREVEILKLSKEKFYTLPIGSPSKKIYYFQIFYSLITSYRIIKKEKPDKIFAFGSYASFPILFWGLFLKIPYYLHEQNTIPGKTIKIFSKRAKKIFISFLDTKKYIKTKNVVFSGMPVRDRIGKIIKEEGLNRFDLERDRITFLLIGGSGGSKFLLNLIKEFEDLISAFNLQGIIIKGSVEFNEKLKFKSIVLEYINDIEYAYGASDFVISRCGASTIWEIVRAQKPVITVPIRTSDHQIKNSNFIIENKIGVVLKEEEKDNFPKVLEEFLRNINEYRNSFNKINYLDPKDIIIEEIKNDK